MPSSHLHSLNGYINNYKNVLILPIDLSNLKYLLSGPIRKKNPIPSLYSRNHQITVTVPTVLQSPSL